MVCVVVVVLMVFWEQVSQQVTELKLANPFSD